MPTRKALAAEQGSATVEFILLVVLLLIPVIYFMVLSGQVQSAGYASVAASEQAARAMADAPNDEAGHQRVEGTVDRTLHDYGIDRSQSEVIIECSQDPCVSGDGVVSATVVVRVRLPLVPSLLGNETTVATLDSTAHHSIGMFE